MRYVTDWKATDFFWALRIDQSSRRAAIASHLLYPCPSSQPTFAGSCTAKPTKDDKTRFHPQQPKGHCCFHTSVHTSCNFFGFLLHLGSKWNSKKQKVESSSFSVVPGAQLFLNGRRPLLLIRLFSSSLLDEIISQRFEGAQPGKGKG